MMNYYVQGNAANADKIKAAFEKLGCDTTGWKFNVEGGFYYTHDGRIDLACGKFLINLIKTHPDYKELELPVETEFKVGDWIVRGKGFVYEPSLITEIKDYYICELLNGERVTYTLNDVHKNFHLWTIADAKDGDVLAYQGEIFIARIARGLSVNVAIDYDCCYDGNSFILDSFYSLTVEELKRVHPATKEQRELLFAKMKEAGYEWDADKKELRKIKPHYDIANFRPFDKVLVRDHNNNVWRCDFFSHYDNKVAYPFVCTGTYYMQCIPYNEETKHLLGTTDMCSEEYINW